MQNKTKKQPNILMIMADQLRSDALGCYGNTEINTPNIDQLALQGTTFDNHYCQTPVCMPSRASILTGRYPKNIGTRDNGIPLRDAELCFPESLQEAGYRTAAIGKMHITSMLVPKENEHDDWPTDKYGFEVIHTSTDSKDGEYLAWLKETSPEDYAIVKKQGEDKVREDTASPSQKQQNGPPQVHLSKVNAEFHQSTWIANQSIKLIEEKANGKDDRPFFILTSFVDPHHPFDPPISYAERYPIAQLKPPYRCANELDDKPPHFMKHAHGIGFSNEKYDYTKLSQEDWLTIKAAYYGMISLMDEEIGRILACLKENDLERDTLILFTSDHGELLGDHGLLFKGPFHYDCVISVPLIISWPDKIPQGSRIRGMSEHVDIMPTLLAYAGVALPYGVQGVSLEAMIGGDSSAGKAYALTEFNALDWGLKLKTLTNECYKLTYYANQNYGELYDRAKDPHEFVNLWDSEAHQDIKHELLIALLDRLINTEDDLPIRIGKY